jgi:CubicO group peptidase (beta-lactamase class C family)
LTVEAAIRIATALKPGYVLGRLDENSSVVAHGYSDLQQSDPMRPGSIFRIDSLTKPVIAVALLTLLDEQSIALDVPIARWLPELANPRVLVDPMGSLDRTVTAARVITIADVLTSRMGTGILLAPPGTTPIQREIERLGLVGFGPPAPDSPLDQDEWIKRLGTLPLLAHPGESWFYNVSSLVQGLLISRISDRSLASFLRERVFLPLEMVDTDFQVSSDNSDRLVPAFTADLTLFDPKTGSSWAAPPAHEGAGGLVSTVPDYLKFVEMLHGRRQRLIGDDALASMLTDHLTEGQRSAAAALLDGKGWGFGLSPDAGTARDVALRGRVGWAGGVGTSWVSDFGQDKAVVVFSNRALDAPEVYAGHQALHREILD